jgi:hypothetical protein
VVSRALAASGADVVAALKRHLKPGGFVRVQAGDLKN